MMTDLMVQCYVPLTILHSRGYATMLSELNVISNYMASHINRAHYES